MWKPIIQQMRQQLISSIFLTEIYFNIRGKILRIKSLLEGGGLIALIQHNLWECNLSWLTGSLCCRNENLDFSQSLCPSKIYYLLFDYESSSVTMKKLYNCSRSKYFNWISSSTSPSREDYGYSSELIARFITRLILLPVSTCNVYVRISLTSRRFIHSLFQRILIRYPSLLVFILLLEPILLLRKIFKVTNYRSKISTISAYNWWYCSTDPYWYCVKFRVEQRQSVFTSQGMYEVFNLLVWQAQLHWQKIELTAALWIQNYLHERPVPSTHCTYSYPLSEFHTLYCILIHYRKLINCLRKLI